MSLEFIPVHVLIRPTVCSSLTMPLKFILVVLLFLLGVKKSGGSECTTFQDSNGNWKVNCSQSQVPRLVLEHILWLEAPGSKQEMIDVEVPNYKINGLIRGGFKGGSESGNTRVNILLKKPEVTYEAEVGPSSPQIPPPSVGVKYEEVSPIRVHYPNDKAYLISDGVIPTPPQNTPDVYTPPTSEPDPGTETTTPMVNAQNQCNPTLMTPSEQAPLNGCIPKIKIDSIHKTNELDECLGGSEFSQQGMGGMAMAPVTTEDRDITSRPLPTPPPTSGSSGSSSDSSPQVIYMNLLMEIANQGLSETRLPSQMSQGTFESNYCLPTIGKDTVFTSFNMNHSRFVSQLQSILLQDRTSLEDTLQRAEELMNYSDMNVEALYNALVGVAFADTTLSTYDKLERWKVLPHKFFHAGVIDQVLVAVKRTQQPQEKDCIKSDESVGGRSESEDSEEENKLWYFREDPLVNANHGIWHAANPTQSPLRRNDRRGELFYYFHHHVIARYNAERLSNGLELVLSFPLAMNQTVQEGYSPNLRTSSYTGSDNYNIREPGRTFTSIGRLSVQGIITDKERISEAIRSGRILDMNNQSIPLTNEEGIDYLGEAVEPGTFIHACNYYGNFHGRGHPTFSFINNVTGEQTSPGVMSDVDLAMRDPIFYRWHSMVDDVLNSWNAKLPPYTRTGGDHPLQWSQVKVVQFGVQSGDSDPNHLDTFWKQRNYELLQNSVTICGKHLDHKDFKYQIGIESTSQMKTDATIRIFMAPRYKNNGERFTMAEQHLLFFVMDTFSIELEGGKTRSFEWPSTQTTLTSDSITGDENKTQSCGCGWPHHLLLPKGTPQGMIFDLFVMVTEGAYPYFFDEENAIKKCEKDKRRVQCRAAPLLCGVRGKKYPDALPMGYPFDRRPYSSTKTLTEVEYLEDYIEGITNMGATQVTITHKDDFSYL